MLVVKIPPVLSVPGVWSSPLFRENNSSEDILLPKSAISVLNVSEHPTDYEVEFATPEFRQEEFEVNVENGILSITGEKKPVNKNNGIHKQSEFRYNSFTCSISLPENADQKAINVKYERNLLKLIIAKRNP